MITVYLGDSTPYLSRLVCDVDPTAKLITEANYKDISTGTYYTCIGDVGGLPNLGEVLRCADQIVYAPPPNGRWTDEKHGVSGMKQWTEDYLRIFSFRTTVKNFSVAQPENKNKFLALADLRKGNNNQLWVAGCSISLGVGVDVNQRYGELLADSLDLPVSFLAKNGSSISWAADQILRSDIRKGDLLVWGLTNTQRVPWVNNGSIHHVLVGSYLQNVDLNQQLGIDYLDSEDLLYRSTIAVFQVINYCKKIGVNLLLVSMINNGTWVEYLRDCSILLQLCGLWGRTPNDLFLDQGDDGWHPGPATHKFYANEILAKLKQLEWI